MIRRPTVLVLGAGASAHLGYPTGNELVNQIINLLESPQSHEIGLALKAPSDKLNIFATRLRNSGQSSIDEWLEANRDMAAIGRGLIAYIIGKKENLSAFHQDSWYKVLFRYMSQEATLGDLARNRIAFITFNYDRSLEAFLFQAIQGQYPCTEEQCATIINQIPIIHIYGQAGFLPWQGLHPAIRSYGAETMDRMAAMQCSQAIRVMSEGPDGRETMERAKKWLMPGYCGPPPRDETRPSKGCRLG